MDNVKLLKYFSGQQKNFEDLIKNLVSWRTFTGEKKNIQLFMENLKQLFSEFSPQISATLIESGSVLTLEFFPQYC